MTETQPLLGMTYTLNEVERRLAEYLAKARHTANRQAGTENKRVGPQSDERTDLEGIGGELAFCAIFNVYPDLTLGPRRGGYDAILLGQRVDTKTTSYTNGRLLAVPFKQSGDVDLYALMVGTFPTYACRGFAGASQLVAVSRLIDLGHGPTYAMDQDELYMPLGREIFGRTGK